MKLIIKIINLVLLLLLFRAISFSQNISSNSLLLESDWYKISPLSSVSLQMYYYSSNYPRMRYLLHNSDGDFIDQKWTPFLNVSGNAKFFSYFNFGYKIQGSEHNRFLVKHAAMEFKTDAISFMVGKNSVWLGHGYHGSLLLSNNAEPFKLIKFQTEQPFRIPYIGRFNYLIFNGWTQNFKILAQRFTYFPVSWLELGLNQTVIYQRNYKLWEFFKILSASQENLSGHYNNDQRASMDIALHMPFLKNFPPLKNGKIYFEYAGEDIYAWWQPEDGKWLGPIGIDFFDTGITMGILLETENSQMRAEYSQNYSVKTIFYDIYSVISNNTLYSKKWYTTIPFVSYGAVMGHHMGVEADDLYFELKHRWDKNSIKLFFDKERHGLASGFGSLWNVNNNPELMYQYGIEYFRLFNSFSVNIIFMYNHYQNTDLYPKILEVIPSKGRRSDEYIGGVTFNYNFD